MTILCHNQVGGRNTVLERAFIRNGIPFVSEVPTIIFGADVTHSPPGEDSASSIAAVSTFLANGSSIHYLVYLMLSYNIRSWAIL